MKTTEKKNEILILSESMNKSIKSETVDIISNVGEIGVDVALNDGILRDVPLISTAVSLFKIGNTIRERSLLEKMYFFVKEMNSGCENDTEREKRAEYFKNDKRKRAEELKYLLILLDRYISTERAEWLAKVYLHYLENKISWNEVLIFSECIDKIIPADLEYLEFYFCISSVMPLLDNPKNINSFRKAYAEEYRNCLSMISDENKTNRVSKNMRIRMHTERLVSAGLIQQIPVPVDVAYEPKRMYSLSYTGILFKRIILGYEELYEYYQIDGDKIQKINVLTNEVIKKWEANSIENRVL